MLNFSVLMPVYFKENPVFLTEAIESILVNQTIKPTQLLIVEDGPLTVELSKVIAKYYIKFPKVISSFKLKKNMGMGYSMNYGLNLCSNEWIFRMDSDDIAVPTRFEKQLNLIELGEFDIIGSAIEEFNYTVGDLKQFRIMPELQKDIVNFMKTRNPINHMSVAFRKSVALRAGGYWNKRYLEDYNLWYEMYMAGARFYNIQEVLVYARIGNNMVERRSGYAYHQYETELMKKFLTDKFINIFEYRLILALKLILRILPVRLLTLVYKYLLRKDL